MTQFKSPAHPLSPKLLSSRINKKSSKNTINHNTMNYKSSKEIETGNSSRHKGVVPQHNGRWGAQIYERHQRIWLGTFSTEIEAAKAYDIAVQRFRGTEAITNFKCMSESHPNDVAELGFLSAHSKEEIVDMLRKHTYNEEFKHSLRKRKSSSGGITNCDKSECMYLFHKTVTPSDVGKLNRLVIPKVHAEKHFQTICMDPKGVLINFEDGEGKVWRFRYSYWKSSQSYVLTKGWSRFVKEKGLKAGDVVSFWQVPNGDGFKEILIDCKFLKSGTYLYSFLAKSVDELELQDHDDDDSDEVTIRLFGVNIICKGQCNGSLNMNISSSGVEKLHEGAHLSKKSCLFKFG